MYSDTILKKLCDFLSVALLKFEKFYEGIRETSLTRFCKVRPHLPCLRNRKIFVNNFLRQVKNDSYTQVVEKINVSVDKFSRPDQREKAVLIIT